MTDGVARGLAQAPRPPAPKAPVAEAHGIAGQRESRPAASAQGRAASGTLGTGAHGTPSGADPAAEEPVRDSSAGSPGGPAGGPGPRGRGTGPGSSGAARGGVGAGAGARAAPGPLPRHHLLLPDSGGVPKDPSHRVFAVADPVPLLAHADGWRDWELGCLVNFPRILETGYGGSYRVVTSLAYTGQGNSRKTSRPEQFALDTIAVLPWFGPKVSQKSEFDAVAVVRTGVETSRGGRIGVEHDPTLDVVHIMEATLAGYKNPRKAAQILLHLEDVRRWVRLDNPRAVVYSIMTDHEVTRETRAHFEWVLGALDTQFPGAENYIVYRLVRQGPRQRW